MVADVGLAGPAFEVVVIGLAASLSIGALLLPAAADWTVKLDVPFGKAFWTMFFANLLNGAVGFVIGLVIGGSGGPPIMASIIYLPIGFFVASGIIGRTLGLNYAKAMLVTVVMWALGIGLCLLLGGSLLLFLYLLH